MYVDYDANNMYDFEVDGELFDVSSSVVNTDLDLCCLDAVSSLNLDVMNLACVTSIVEEDDEFFTFDDTQTCIRSVDRVTDYFTHADSTMATRLYTHMGHCVEEVVDRDECCQAKLDGYLGRGLENACENSDDFPDGYVPDVKEYPPFRGFSEIEWHAMTAFIEEEVEPWFVWANTNREGTCNTMQTEAG